MANDYADIINAYDYTQGLAEHPDIPQADAGVVRVIREKLRKAKGLEFRVLDLGCGPGRITKYLADELAPLAQERNTQLSVMGLDISDRFIEHAKAKRAHDTISYVQADFLAYDFNAKFDVILMQGLFHHVPLSDRKRWLDKCRESLADDGIVIVGDEFVPPYSSKEERVNKVAGLYAYVVAYAIQNGHKSLAEIESMNMVDDVCAGLPGAGHSDSVLLAFIQDTSKRIYTCAHEKGMPNGECNKPLSTLVTRIQTDAKKVAATDSVDHNRGDYKISIEEQVEQMAGAGMKLERQQIYGPVSWLGGMGVLVFSRAQVT